MEDKITTIPKLRRNYKDTKANLDALTGLKDEDLGYATDETILYRQNGAGAANWEAITSAGTPMATGTYTGNDGAGRAIPHGLGATPKLVLIHSTNGLYFHRILDTWAAIHHLGTVSVGSESVTAMDGTNFYVDGTDKEANSNAIVYRWFAIG